MFSVSHIYDCHLTDKVLHGNRVSSTATYSTFADVAVATTVLNTCCATFNDNIKTKSNFLQSRIIAYDYDHAETTVEELEEFLYGYQYAILATQSHLKWKGEEAPIPRFRLIVPLKEAVLNSSSYSSTYDSIQKMFYAPDDSCMRNGVQYMRQHKEILSACDSGKMFDPVHTIEQHITHKPIIIDGDNELDSMYFNCVKHNNIEAWNLIGTPGKTYKNQIIIIFACKRSGISKDFIKQEMMLKIENCPDIHQRTLDTIDRIYKQP